EGEVRLGAPFVAERAGGLRRRDRLRRETPEVPLVLARQLEGVLAKRAARLRLRPAQECLVRQEVGLPQVADVVEVEAGRVPVETIREPEAALARTAEADRPAMAGQRTGVRVHREV